MDKCLEQLEEQLRAHRIECRRAEPLSRWTTFRIGGPAALFCQPRNKEELSLVIGLCRQTGARRYFLGNGSNVLFDDAGFDGIVIEIGAAFSAIEVQGAQIVAGAGAKLADVCLAAAGHALSGLEFAYGIPGRVGGAVYMNAGAYGGEIKDVLVSATFLDELGGEHTIPAGELEMGHRTSLFAKKPWCIVSARFALTPGNEEEIRAKMDDFTARRAEKQPLDMPSAGSMFKRPPGAFAGALIDECGLRGFSVGGASISEKHCGFVVNLGNATCADVIALTDEVRRIVQKKTGYVLEREVRVVK